MSKKITVRYFAIFREHAGIDAETVALDVETAADVFDATKTRHPPRGSLSGDQSD